MRQPAAKRHHTPSNLDQNGSAKRRAAPHLKYGARDDAQLRQLTDRLMGTGQVNHFRTGRGGQGIQGNMIAVRWWVRWRSVGAACGHCVAPESLQQDCM